MRPLALAVTLSLGVASLVGAQQRFVHLGARAAAMGGAFTAVADDATAFYWNPAGYAFGPVVQGGFHWSDSEMDRVEDAEGSSFTDRATGFGLGLTFMAVGGTFSRHTTSRSAGGERAGEGLETFDLAVSLLHSLPLDNLVVAGNVHYLSGEAHSIVEPASSLARTSDLLSGAGVTSSKATFDIGALYEPNPRLRVGVLWRRLVEPRFATPTGGEIVLPRHARAGVAFRLRQRTLLSFDVDVTEQGSEEERWRELSLGVERRLFEGGVSLRAGLRAETGSSGGARPALSLGAAARIRFVDAEVAYVVSRQGRDEGLWFSVTLAP